jgi:AbrB family looped-hinge helix DNA binding protein
MDHETPLAYPTEWVSAYRHVTRRFGLFQARRAQARRSGRATVILNGMTSRVGPKGQVVIPKELRDELGIEPGDEVDFWLDGDHVAVRRSGPRRALRGRFAGERLTDILIDERRSERRREDRR